MDWIKTLLPLVGVALGWLLSESGKILTDRRKDRRKLNKTLYFLLELRYQFTQELMLGSELDRLQEVLKTKLAEKLGLLEDDPELAHIFQLVFPVMKNELSGQLERNSRYEYLSENIDAMMIELSEVFPILTFELTGQHKLRERLENASSYFRKMQEQIKQAPFDLGEWFSPELTNDLLEDLDDSILQVASLVGRSMLKKARLKVERMSSSFDEEDVDARLDQFLEKVMRDFPGAVS
ncbi:MAG: hypothetical protein ACK5W1_14460 [Flavobacteriales bacterium]